MRLRTRHADTTAHFSSWRQFVLLTIALAFAFAQAADVLGQTQSSPAPLAADSPSPEDGSLPDGPRARFEAANQAYASGDFEAAIVGYEAVLAQYSHCASEYNLGNAHFKVGELGRAILHYERAKALNPSNDDILSNLVLANLRVIDRIEPLPSNGLSDLWERVVAPGWFPWYARGFVLLWTLGFVALAWRLFARDTANRRILGSVASVLLLLGALSGWLSLGASARIDNSRRAIILEPTVDVWSAPEGQASGASNAALFVLHEGTKVRMLDSTLDWQEIELENGQVGWLPKASLGEI